MKKSYLFVAGLALMSAFTACSNDNEPAVMVQGPKQSLEIQSVGLAQVGTKSGITAAEFAAGSEIGVYVVRTNLGAAYEPSSSTDYKNVKFTQGSPWSTTSTVFLTNTEGTVFAYYPYDVANAALDGTAIPVSVAADQETGQTAGTSDKTDAQKDYMYAKASKKVTNASPAVTLEMQHALAMVSFKFVRATSFTGVGDVSKIVLKNGEGKKLISTGAATLNIQTGVFAGIPENQANTITVQPSNKQLLGETAEAQLPRMLIYPKAGDITAGDAKVTVTVDNQDYTVNIPAITGGFTAGSNYQFTYTMTGTGMQLTNVSIKAWTPAPKDGGSIATPDPAEP